MSASVSGVVCHHEWGTLKEAIVGISPADQFVIPYWYSGLDFMPPKFKSLSQSFGGCPLIQVDSDFAKAMEAEVDQYAELLASEGVIVHRPTQLRDPERTFLTESGEGAQLYPRDDILVINKQVIEIGLKIQWRRREVYGLRPIIAPIAASAGTNWTGMPIAAPPAGRGGEDDDPNNCFLAGGDILLNGYDVYVGNSGLASNTNGIRWLRRQLGNEYSVWEIPIRREALHLDACMSLLGPGLGMICRSWVKMDELPGELKNFTWIDVPENQAELLACNVCVLDETRVILPAQQTQLGNLLQTKYGRDVLYTPYDNIVQLGGGLRCSHHPLVRLSHMP